VKDAAATAGAAMDAAADVGAGAGPSSAAEAVPTRDAATAAATMRILSFRVAAICSSVLVERRDVLLASAARASCGSRVCEARVRGWRGRDRLGWCYIQAASRRGPPSARRICAKAKAARQ
jgi:hypothetical protein